MTVDLSFVSLQLLSLCATYLMHSTLLIGGVWCWTRLWRSGSHALEEQLWKWAAVGGLLTTAGQFILPAAGPSIPLLPASMARSLSESDGAHSPAIGGPGDDRTQFATDTVPHAADVQLSVRAETDYDAPGSGAAEVIGTSSEPLGVEGTHVRLETLASAATSSGSLQNESAVGQTTPGGAIILGLCLILVAPLGVGLVRVLWQNACFARRVAGCREITAGPARELLDALCRQAGVKRPVRLLSSPRESEPAAFGLINRRIVLPAQMPASLSAPHLRALLAHELAHLVRHDAAWLWFGRLLCNCCPFQPLNFLARRRWQRAAEFLCDDWAVEVTGNRVALARCLAEVAGWKLQGAKLRCALAATGKASGLAHRVERLVRDAPLTDAWSPVRRRRLIWVPLLCLLSAVVGWAPRAAISAAVSVDVTARTLPAASEGESSRLELAEEETAVADAPDARETLPPSVPAIAASFDWRELRAELQALELETAELEAILAQVPPEMRTLQMDVQVKLRKIQQRQHAIRAFLRQQGETLSQQPREGIASASRVRNSGLRTED